LFGEKKGYEKLEGIELAHRILISGSVAKFRNRKYKIEEKYSQAQRLFYNYTIVIEF
jgi:hypothetical protein